MTSAVEDDLKTAAGLLRSARHAVVFTGAGISTPSGIPDFRSAGSGLWERYDPMQVASLDTFRTHPARFYDWLRPLLQSSWAAQPNPAHLALADMESRGILKAVITQNIDNLHQRAGSQHVYEVHGSMRTMTCLRCKKTFPSEQFLDQLCEKDNMPHCPHCQQILKPDVTLFGEMLPEQTWAEAEAHCARADVVLVAGSSLEVWPAAALPALAVERGAHLIINNLTATPLDEQADVLINLNVAEALPDLARLTG